VYNKVESTSILIAFHHQYTFRDQQAALHHNLHQNKAKVGVREGAVRPSRGRPHRKKLNLVPTKKENKKEKKTTKKKKSSPNSKIH
jgi:hypothetical protein